MKDYILVFGRIITIMLLLLACTLLIMGKRPIGELPVFDFLSIIVIGAIVGADIADPKIEHLPTAFAVLVLALFQRAVAELALHRRWFNRLINFEPTMILKDGVFIYKNIKKIKYTIEEILMLLRDKEVFDISMLSHAVIESNGRISILKKPEFDTPTMKAMNLQSQEADIHMTVILEGKVQWDNLKTLSVSESELKNIIELNGYKAFSEIFYGSLNKSGSINISPYK